MRDKLPIPYSSKSPIIVMDNKFEKENIMDANNNMQETQIKPSNENIHGWLSFFLFCIGLRGAFNFFASIIFSFSNLLSITKLCL